MRATILPNFLIAGAAKSGTTSLHYYLNQHPEAFMCTPKEPQFFLAQFARLPMNGIGDNKKKFIHNFQDYCKLFENAVGKKAIGEASWTNLYYYERTIPYIKKYLGDPRIIIILRNPVSRAFSAYMSLVKQGREWLPFEEALSEEVKRRERYWRHCWFYKAPGFYYKQVDAYLKNFSKVKVYLYDELKENTLLLVQDMYEFLCVNPSFIPDINIRLNISGMPRFKFYGLLLKPGKLKDLIAGAGKLLLTEKGWHKVQDSLGDKLLLKPGMKPATKKYLEELYHEDLLKLQVLINKDLSHWMNREEEAS